MNIEYFCFLLSPGYVLTDFRLDRLPIMTDQSRCLRYWVAYVRGSTILQKNCISTYPRWMHELRDVIGDAPLHTNIIPGTHNSGSWNEYTGTLGKYNDHVGQSSYAEKRVNFSTRTLLLLTFYFKRFFF